jgi:hypothetical protein
MKYVVCIVVGLLATAFAQAQIGPKPPSDKIEWTLLAADASSRALDVYSTHEMLLKGWHEEILPNFLVKNTAVMATYSAGTVALDYFVTRRLEQHHHRKLARLITAIDLGQDLPFAIHNLVLEKETHLPLLPVHGTLPPVIR